MMHVKKRSQKFPVSSQLHLNRAHQVSLATVKELIHIGNAHLKILRYDLGAFLERIKDNGMIKYSRDLHPHEQLVIMVTFAERTLNLLCKRTYTHKSLKPHSSRFIWRDKVFSIRYEAFAFCFLIPSLSFSSPWWRLVLSSRNIGQINL